MSAKPVYLVSGAKSSVGRLILELLQQRGDEVWALSRGDLPAGGTRLHWMHPGDIGEFSRRCSSTPPVILLAVAPLWSVAETIAACEGLVLQKIVALGSTSEYTKIDSSDVYDQSTVSRLRQGAEQVFEITARLQISCVLLRTTMIYGPEDRNLVFWRRFARYSPVLPLIAGGQALRQPVHQEDVAAVMLLATAYHGKIREFVIAGPRPLSYRRMLEVICQQLGVRRWYVSLPVVLLQAVVMVIRLLPGFRSLRPSMIERMQQDMIFPIDKAREELGFNPREFGSRSPHTAGGAALSRSKQNSGFWSSR